MSDPPGEDHVPIFGTWARIYAAVLVTAVLAVAASFVFSRWAF
jgi:hypothetical protein